MAVTNELKTILSFSAKLGPLNKAFDKINALKNGVVVIAGAAAVAGGALFALATSASNTGDRIAKLSKSLGVSGESLQELGFAAERSGASTTELETGLRTLARTVFEASTGSAEYKENFDRLGISVNKANGDIKTSDDILAEIADKFKVLPDGIEKTALAQEFFGRAGAKLIPLLNEGASGIEALRVEANQLGGVLSNEALKSAEKFSDEMFNVQFALTGLKNEIGTALFPVFIDLFKQFQTFIKANREIVKQKIEKVFKFIAKAVILLGKAFFKLIAFAAKLPEILERIAVGATAAGIALLIMQGPAVIAGFQRLTRVMRVFSKRGLRTVSKALSAVNIKMLLIPLAIAIIAEDIFVFSKGGKSAIGLMIEGFKKLGKILDESFDLSFINQQLDFVRELLSIVKEFKTLSAGTLAKKLGKLALQGAQATTATITAPFEFIGKQLFESEAVKGAFAASGKSLTQVLNFFGVADTKDIVNRVNSSTIKILDASNQEPATAP